MRLPLNWITVLTALPLRRLSVLCPDILFLPSLSSIMQLPFSFFSFLYTQRLPSRGGTCLYSASLWNGYCYIYPSFLFPGMWPGSYWWRGVRRQWAGSKVKAFAFALLCLTVCSAALTVLLWPVNQTCPLGFSAREKKKKSSKMRWGVWAFVCIRVCSCTCMQACACLLFSRLPQPYNMSQDYPALSFLIRISLFHSLCLPQPRLLFIA